MRARGVFPEVAVKMTEVGEATGALQDMLTSLSEFYDLEKFAVFMKRTR